MAGSHVLKTKLTKEDKLTNQDKITSQNTPPTHPSHATTTDNFEFPTLNIDGSVPDLIETHPPQGQRTPPAALSTLGLKMAHDTPTDNLTDLNDGQYDMVDDASDVSNDTNETVSIASDNLTSEDEDTFTPEESDGVQDLDDLLDMPDHPSATGYSADPAHQHMFRRTRNLKRGFRKAHEEQAQAALQKEHESNEREKTLDSFLSEDLETPRQSTMNAFMTSSAMPIDEKNTLDMSTHSGHSESAKAERLSKTGSWGKLQTRSVNLFRKAMPLAFFGLMTLILGSIMSLNATRSFLQVDTRREALSSAIFQLSNSSDTTKTFDIEHLLPVPVPLNSTTNIFGLPEEGTLDVHFQGVNPNYIVVSLPRRTYNPSPQIKSTHVHKGDKSIAFNQTKLIDSVYAITVDPQEAHGVVTISMLCSKPAWNITVSHNFGHRYFQLPNFEKARTDISNTVTKDVAVARAGVRGLTDRMTAGIAATHNVSSHLAQQMSHEAQILANTATSMVGKLYNTCPTAADMRKDLVAIQDGFARAETQVDDFVADMAGRVKRSVMEPLAVAQDRAGRIRAKYFGGEAAREKVCTRDRPVKDFTAPFFSPPPKVPVSKPKQFGKSGELVEKKTCGSCNANKISLPKKACKQGKQGCSRGV
jgi:hypothetical protein